MLFINVGTVCCTAPKWLKFLWYRSGGGFCFVIADLEALTGFRKDPFHTANLGSGRTHRTESGRNRAFLGEKQPTPPQPHPIHKHVNLPMPSPVSEIRLYQIQNLILELTERAMNGYFPVNVFILSVWYLYFPQFHFNPAQSILVMEGEDLENINAAVRKVSYINSRQFPTPGIRRLHISTAVQYVQRFLFPPPCSCSFFSPFFLRLSISIHLFFP